MRDDFLFQRNNLTDVGLCGIPLFGLIVGIKLVPLCMGLFPQGVNRFTGGMKLLHQLFGSPFVVLAVLVLEVLVGGFDLLPLLPDLLKQTLLLGAQSIQLDLERLNVGRGGGPIDLRVLMLMVMMVPMPFRILGLLVLGMCRHDGGRRKDQHQRDK